jgi:hypothetical protein
VTTEAQESCETAQRLREKLWTQDRIHKIYPISFCRAATPSQMAECFYLFIKAQLIMTEIYFTK